MNRQTLRTLASVFGWCFLLSVGFQLLVFGLFVGLHEWGYRMHSRFFAISPQEFDLAAYYVFALMKTAGMLLFLIPWAALRIVASRAPE